jgi:hypothetical protein
LNLFVIFPPGLGGNHLANILSLDPKFSKRFDVDRYDQRRPNAHHAYMQNLDCVYVEKNLETLKNQNNVFCGHLVEYMTMKLQGLTDHFKDKVFFMIQMPQKTETAYKRLEGQNGQTPHWLLSEVGLCYMPDNFKRLVKEDLNIISYFVWPAYLFDQNLTPLLESLSQAGYDINFDKELAQTLHTKWFNNLNLNGSLNI